MMRFETRYYKIEVLTPIHPGTGEDLSPLEYVLHNGRIHMLDRVAFMEQIIASGRYDNFLDIASKGTVPSILVLRKFVRENFSEDCSLNDFPVDSGLAKEIETKLDKPSFQSSVGERVLNRLAIKAAATTPQVRLPYIPGSAFKGALRNSLLNLFARENKPRMTGKSDSRKLEQVLFKIQERDTSDDPLRAVKVSDFRLVEGGSRFGTAFNERPPDSEREGGTAIPVHLEYVDPGTVFAGSVVFDREALVGRKIDPDLAARAMREHGRESYAFEKAKFNSRHPRIEGSSERAFGMKLGFHSGAFNMTVAGFRKIRNIKTGMDMESQSTTWKIKGTQMGWVLLSIIERAEFEDLQRRADALFAACKTKRDARIAGAKEKSQAAQEQRRRKEEDLAAKRAEERAAAESRRAKLNSADPRVWAKEFAKGHWDRDIQPYLRGDVQDAQDERRKALALYYFRETEDGKAKRKKYRKRLRDDKASGLIKALKELVPELFA